MTNRELDSRYGVKFTSLLTITNMPIGRFGRTLDKLDKKQEYENLQKNSFNPMTIEGLMCRHHICIRWDGTLYDCDFNLALDLPVDHCAPNHLNQFDKSALENRTILRANIVLAVPLAAAPHAAEHWFDILNETKLKRSAIL